MHNSTKTLAVITLACAAALAFHDAHATSIARCATSDGGFAYTDGNCSAIGGRPAAMPMTLVRKLAQAGDAPSDVSAPGIEPATQTGGSYAAGSGRGPGQDACARTPDQLQFALQTSMAMGDVNRLAAIYDWSHVSGRQSVQVLRRLEQLTRNGGEDMDFSNTQMHRVAGCLLLSL